MRMLKKSFTALIRKEEDYYVAKCAEVDTIGWGYSVEEAIENLKTTTELFLQRSAFTEMMSPALTNFDA